MKKLKPILLAVAVLLALSAPAREYRVKLGEVAATLRSAQPGDKIVVEDGAYRDRKSVV